ncbi:MAG TPA: hypothetical protein VFZ69_13035 [Longimicrobiales bacterium]
MSSRTEVSADEPRTVDEAKQAVELSRQRISSTLDALEDRIVEKKHALQDRVDVLRPVRDQVTGRPLTAVAVALGVGALLGSLRRDHEDEADPAPRSDRESPRSRLSERDRAELREWRRMRRDRLRARERERSDHPDGSRLASLRHQLTGAITSAIGAAVTARVKEMTRGGHRR